jgi:hypothetical protein
MYFQGRYPAMINIAFFASLGMTVVSLLFGLFVFFQGNPKLKQYSNLAMRLRVIFQGLTLLFFFLMLWVGR